LERSSDKVRKAVRALAQKSPSRASESIEGVDKKKKMCIVGWDSKRETTVTRQTYSETPIAVTPLSEQDVTGERETAVTGQTYSEAPKAIAPLSEQEVTWENETRSGDEKTASSGKAGLGKILIGLGIGLAIGIFGAGRMGRNPPANPERAAAQPAAMTTAPSQTVTVAPVETEMIAQRLSATGTVAAYDLLPVLSQAKDLQIKRVLVDEGDVVTAGQLMAVLDSQVLQAQLAQAIAALESAKATLLERQAAVSEAEAAVAQAEADQAEKEAEKEQAIASWAQARADKEQADRELTRYEKLATDGAISRQELEIRSTTASSAAEAVRVASANISSAQAKIKSEQANISSAKARLRSAKAAVSSAEANVRSAEANVQQLRTQLAQTEVRAPAGGIVAERIARRGDVTDKQKLFSIIANNALELQVLIPENQLSRIPIGLPVEITSDTDARLSIRGRLRTIAPLVDVATRHATLKIDLPSDFSGTVPLLRPGMFLRAAVTTPAVEGLTVPSEAVQWQADGGAHVYLLDGDNVAQAQPVEVGTSIGGAGQGSRIEIKQGLKKGDRVIVAGAGFVKDGDKVKVVPDVSVHQSQEL